ncbi:thiamine pyrophosphate-binding protein [Pendulispora albinea]|uniref:Thiamine pyrophosphate-binding protein n=1 Tax=Pendulispora albinea TaxID=2741071 RepID=A0ABZ2LLX2_9BACT
MRGSDLLLQSLLKYGVNRVFGILGREAEVLNFHHPELDFFLTRHEFTAGVAADAFARVSGRAQACFSTFGPGATNLATGVASACLDRSPMLAMSAQIETDDALHNHVHQCLDQVEIMRSMCKYASELRDPRQIPAEVRKALEAAYSELMGPSYLSLPVNVLGAEIPDAEGQALLGQAGAIHPKKAPQSDAADLKAVHELLVKAERPVVIVGNSLHREDAVAEARAFVAKYQIPAVSSLASKGIISDDDPCSLGAINRYLNGILKMPVIDEVFGKADVVVLLGFDICEDVKPAMWLTGRKKTIVRIGSTPNEASRLVKTDLDIVGSVKQALQTLNRPENEVSRSNWAADIARTIREAKRATGGNGHQHYPTVPPPAIVREVRRALNGDGILCSDIGLHKQYAGLISETTESNTFLCSNGLGSFGSGMALAIGAKLARPEKKVAAIVGDGGFHSNSQDLEFLARYDLPIVIVMMKDSAYGLIKHYQVRGGQEHDKNLVDFLSVDFVKLAEANGCRGVSVQSSKNLRREIERAFELSEPTLIEVPVQYEHQF